MDGDDEHVGEKEMSGLAKCECGGAPHVWENSPPRAFSATCRACGANGPWKATRPGAVAAWNALPRRSDVAAAFRDAYAILRPFLRLSDKDVALDRLEAHIAELNGGALPTPVRIEAEDKTPCKRCGNPDPDSYLECIGDAIDDALGWESQEEEEEGDYPSRIRRTAASIRVAAMREALEICKREAYDSRELSGDILKSDIQWDDAEAAINARIAELSK